MMKKFLILMAVTLVSATALAQNLSFLRGQRKLACRFDWTELTVDGMDVDDWIDNRNMEQPTYNAKKELEDQLKPQIMLLVQECNERLKEENLYLTHKSDNVRYVLVMKASDIDRRGNAAFMMTILDLQTDKKMAEFPINGKGGKIGSMANLWGDGMRSAGKRLGKFIVKRI